jgi:hypothetical protein
LIAIIEATGPRAIVWCAPCSVRRVAVECLRHSLRDEDHREDDRERQEDVDDRAVEVAPEVPEPDAPTSARDAADDRGGDRHPDAGRDELLHGKPGHLAEVRHRRLAGVVLPVRVRDEARRCVQRNRPRHAGEVIGVEEEVTLEAQQPEEEDAEQDGEHEHRAAVLLPVLVDRRVAAEQAEKRALDDVALLARVDTRHPDAERIAERDENDRVNEDLSGSLTHQLKASRRGRARRRGR